MEERIEEQIQKAHSYANTILQDRQDDSLLSQSEREALQSVHTREYEQWRKQKLKAYNQKANWGIIEKEITAGKNKPKSIRILNIWQTVAAFIVIALTIGAVYWTHHDTQTSTPETIMPGKSIAYLEVNGKKRIDLRQSDTLLLFHKSKAQIDSGKITYTSDPKKKLRNEYHKINVPRNGEYYVVLSDGTKVWVNSESTIGFYTGFEDNKRIVDLQGEAYFEVARDENRPFIVKTNKMDIRVMGTHFNVKAYPDEQYTYATLSEGKILAIMGESNEYLEPNQQMVLNNSKGTYQQKEVDASIYSAWVKGKFIFKDEPLENIMLSLGRWYNVEVFYPNQNIKDELYSMSVNRYDQVEVLLKKMEKTGTLQFELKDKALIVK